MVIIHSIVRPFDKLLGYQKIDFTQHYRPMVYTIFQPIDSGLLLYNTMTKAMVQLSQQETELFNDSFTALPQLIQLWFVVPDSYDDRLLSRQIRNVKRIISKPIKGITSYTIFTTTDCNARCFYCYELGCPRIPMSEETAKKTADYIIRHCKGHNVTLNWFGGEPLYNKTVINTICNILKDANIKYRSTMVSNGYLMDTDTIHEAKELWNLKKIQITLDGTEAVYNRCKAYIYKDVNAYRRVINNIHFLLDAGILVRIRLNIDLHNADNLLILADELGKEFGGKKGISVYLHPLFHYTMKKAAVNNDINRKLVYNKQDNIMELLHRFGLAQKDSLNLQVKTNNCMADNEECITILPTGKIGKCEHYSEDNFIGHIDSEDMDSKMIECFRETQDEIAECASCPLYPNCIRLKMCEDIELCYPEEREKKLSELKRSMLAEYEKFKKK